MRCGAELTVSYRLWVINASRTVTRHLPVIADVLSSHAVSIRPDGRVASVDTDDEVTALHPAPTKSVAYRPEHPVITERSPAPRRAGSGSALPHSARGLSADGGRSSTTTPPDISAKDFPCEPQVGCPFARITAPRPRVLMRRWPNFLE